MNIEKEILALSAQALAMEIIVGNVLSKLANNPTLRPAIVEGFDQAADVIDSVAVQFGHTASPDHTMKALKIIEELRAMVLGGHR